MNRISPRVDVAFKKIFGVEENKDLLISLINSIVSNEDQVVDLTLLNPYNPQNFYRDKLSVLDIKAKGIDGKRFNIEIQISDEADYDKRALYYWAKLYTEQLRVAEDYSLLSKAIGIHILNFVSIPDAAKYHNVFHITEKDSGLLYFKDLELHTIELKKFADNSNEELSDILTKVKNSLDVWLAFLTRNDLLKTDNLPKILDNPELKKAINVLEVMNFTDAEREAYEEHLKWLRIEANTLKKYGEKAKAEGREEGRAEGEIKKAIEIAKKMLAKRKTIEEIMEFTDLPLAEIEKLKS
ncbi:PD-(D/E)XK nuclease family transposase (plasmid) [Candidatus Trichorickettsia mobilis]|uniref:Rpn family recombination-promoting nuclease/putative transposase n=1 Tax=Candidatus Trichorickettsia mobilis TaxID=1346319 RepID=UPI002B25C240|nr:Rpn family recombination-promoting nuclease/putative transposase [Candidatus Trichorickettsia mobilis]WPY01780.1 PD-(D/E)XK nuclease family transposase [Candidatus Trichorickettsia mobilis]